MIDWVINVICSCSNNEYTHTQSDETYHKINEISTRAYLHTQTNAAFNGERHFGCFVRFAGYSYFERIYLCCYFIYYFFFGLLANRSIMTLILQRRFIVVYLHYTLLQALNLPRLLRYCGAPQLVGKQAKGIFFLAASC